MTQSIGGLPAPSAILFDLDGTLVDTVATRIRGWSEAFREAGIDAPHGAIGALIGSDGRRLAREIAAAAGRGLSDEEAEALDDRSGALYSELNTDPQPLRGATALLDALGRSTIAAAIATSSRPGQVHASVAALRLSTAPHIVDGSHVAHAKPDPELLLVAAQQLATEPAACWYVGDATWDMRAARAARMSAIGVPTGAVEAAVLLESGAHVVVETLDEILTELRRRTLV